MNQAYMKHTRDQIENEWKQMQRAKMPKMKSSNLHRNMSLN